MSTKKLIVVSLLLTFTNSIQANPCEGLHNVFLNDHTDCSRYYSCFNGLYQIMTCQDGRWFGLDPPGCYLPNTITCDRCPSEGIINVPIDESCTTFVMCINGNNIEAECSSGLRFDPIEGRCNLQELVQCDHNGICPQTGQHTIADPTNCSNYIICFDGVEVITRECLTGLLWDPVLGSCNREENVVCPHRLFSPHAAEFPTVPNVPNVPIAPAAP